MLVVSLEWVSFEQSFSRRKIRVLLLVAIKRPVIKVRVSRYGSLPGFFRRLRRILVLSLPSPPGPALAHSPAYRDSLEIEAIEHDAACTCNLQEETRLYKYPKQSIPTLPHRLDTCLITLRGRAPDPSVLENIAGAYYYRGCKSSQPTTIIQSGDSPG